MTRRLAATLVVVLGVLLGVFVNSGTAQAVWQCRAWANWPSYAYATCDYGAGGVRVTAYCFDGVYDQLNYGPWVTAGHTSSIVCSGGRFVHNVYYETF
jgi:hypothetical protein